MKKCILIGRSGSGKTTLAQALHDTRLSYDKTQTVKHDGWLIDTPGEYIENTAFGGAVAVHAYESDIVGLLLAANEPYSLFSPNITSMANREVIGIVTKIDLPDARPDRAEKWLRLSGCKKIFYISSKTGQGIAEIKEYLQQKSKK